MELLINLFQSASSGDKLYYLRNFRFVSYHSQASIQRMLDEDFKDKLFKKELRIVSSRTGSHGDIEASIVGQYDDLKKLVAVMCLTSDPEVVNQFPIFEYQDPA